MVVWEGEVFEKNNVREEGTRTGVPEQYLYDGRDEMAKGRRKEPAEKDQMFEH